ncbi:uncharacterized protein pebp4 isoform X3 [Oryzias latipes]
MAERSSERDQSQPGRELKKGKIKGKILTEYQPPTPPQKSGFHRYQFMLFEQLPQTPVSLSDEEKSSRGNLSTHTKQTFVNGIFRHSSQGLIWGSLWPLCSFSLKTSKTEG